MKLTDEILNKYLDNELSRQETTELQQLIKIDDEALVMLKTHKYVDQILQKLEVEAAPEQFTEMVMNKIFETFTVKNKKFPFFRFIISTFVLMLIGIFVYGVTFSLNLSGTENNFDEIIFKSSDILLSAVSFLTNTFSNSIFLMIISSLSLILLLSAYFVFESHKAFKDKIKGM